MHVERIHFFHVRGLRFRFGRLLRIRLGLARRFIGRIGLIRKRGYAAECLEELRTVGVRRYDGTCLALDVFCSRGRGPLFLVGHRLHVVRFASRRVFSKLLV